MKRETNNPNGILYKNKIQNNYKNMFTSKIDEIESLINNENLEEKQKTLEIQKKNAYYKLEKLDKELENIQYYENNENEELEEIDLNEEEILKNKINDIRQKNMKIQEQIKMIKDYYNNFLLKYKNKQIEDKKELKEECNKINADIQINKCFTKMTSEEKIILDKEEEIQKLDGELEKVVKKLEKIRSNKYISDIRLKELKNIIKKNNKNINKKQEKKKKETIKRNNKSENKKSDFEEIISNIRLSQNANINTINIMKKNNNKISQENKIEPTINIINRKLPFSISALDDIINEKNNENEAPKNFVIKTENTSHKLNKQNKPKKNDFNLKINKNVNKVNHSSENKIILNNQNENKINNNININNNNYKKQSNKYRNFNFNKSNVIEQNNKINNITTQEKSENQNKNNNINDNSPLGWLDDFSNIEKKRDDLFNKDNKSNGLSKNFNNNQEDIKINSNEDLNKKESIFNDRNLEISGIQGNFNRRSPFANKIKF